MNNQKPPYRNRGPMVSREEFIINYAKAEGLQVNELTPGVVMLQALIGSVYDQQQMIEYLDNRIIDLERIVYAG